ncbi:MAG: hypothetical protein KGL48_13480 [Sphingomonadales bacterium]|nr:hypothetical protein [Sphingomonadales bacterium]
MLLKGAASSPEADDLVSTIVDRVIVPYRRTQGQVRPSMLPGYRKITEAFLADLLDAAAQGRWSKLSTNNAHLITVPGGKSAFTTLRRAMGAAGLLEELAGYFRVRELFGQKRRRYHRTCFRPSAKLLALAEDHGVLLADFKTPRRPGRAAVSPPFIIRETVSLAPAEVLELLAAKENGERPRRLEVPEDDPQVVRIVADMDRLNAFLLEEGRISGIVFAGLRRLFSSADQPGFAYQWHGRFYSMPRADSYENLEGGKDTRQAVVVIDGKPAREVDISASQLTVFHGLLQVPFDPSCDPYELGGGLDRERVKEWLMFALGSQGSNHGGNRLKKAKLAGLAKYPFLADLPQLGISILDLQFHEAEILRLAMEHLMQQDIGFLPVHDALLVAEGNEEVAVAAIRAAYMQYFTANLGLPSAPVPRVKHDRMARAAFAPDGAQGLSIGLRVPEGAIRLR